MFRKAFTLLVMGAVAFSTSAGGAQSEPARQVSDSSGRAAAAADKGLLPPGGAAGIQQAQAQRSRIRNLAPFALVGGLAAAIVLGTGDDSSVTTTGTN